jgi:hypothetical protein
MMGDATCRDVFNHTEDAQDQLTRLHNVEAIAVGLRHRYELQKASNRSGKPAGSLGGSGKGAGAQRRLQQRLHAMQAGASSSAAAAAAGTAVGTAASATMTQTAPGTATAAATAGTGQDGWVSKQNELRRCGELLQALGSRVWSLLPQRYACNNLACANLAGVSEGLLVAGKASCVDAAGRQGGHCAEQSRAAHPHDTI